MSDECKAKSVTVQCSNSGCGGCLEILILLWLCWTVSGISARVATIEARMPVKTVMEAQR